MQVVFDGGTNDDLVVMGIIVGASNDCCCCGFEATSAVAAATAAAAEEDANVLKSAAFSISIGGISIKVEGGILGCVCCFCCCCCCFEGKDVPLAKDMFPVTLVNVVEASDDAS